MVEPATGSAYLKELDTMIGRAAAACERYRQAASQQGMPESRIAVRRKRFRTMEAILARLLAQRANEVSDSTVRQGAKKGAA